MNYKYLVIGLLGTVAAFHIGAVSMIIGNQYQLTSPDYYNKETEFPALQSRVNAGRDLTWSHRLLEHEGRLELAVKTAEGDAAPLTGVVVHLYKPDRAEMDRKLELQLTDKGTWQADIGNLAPGRWRTTYEVVSGEQALAWVSELRQTRSGER